MSWVVCGEGVDVFYGGPKRSGRLGGLQHVWARDWWGSVAVELEFLHAVSGSVAAMRSVAEVSSDGDVHFGWRRDVQEACEMEETGVVSPAECIVLGAPILDSSTNPQTPGGGGKLHNNIT